jgi:hypothetical protein
MLRTPARSALVVSLLALLVSCGDQSLFMSPKTGAADLQITSATDGQVFGSGKSVPLMISAQDATKSRDLEVDVTVGTAAGESLWHSRATAALNEQSPITLPANLAAGLYRLDLVLYSAGEVVQRKSVSFFVAQEGWKISGIRSFPPVITSGATVMLKAELDVPDASNPYLRWTWKGKVIQKGMLSAGLGQILWDVPGEGGVYTITLELFPIAPPAGSDFQFTSSLSLSTDIIVSGGPGQVRGRLGPASSFMSLLRLQASLADSGAGAKKMGKDAAIPIGSPEVVSLENGFGYRLDGSTGIRIPWLAIPSDAGNLRPCTISLGVSFDDMGSANKIVTAAASDGTFSLVIAMNPQTSAPEARVTRGGAPSLLIPWGGPALSPKQRVLLSLSIVPQPAGLAAQWFLDGVQVSRMEAQYPVAGPKQDGSITIGGEQGFKGVVDEFGVYSQDSAGRPSTDPDLYARAQAGLYGSRLVLADGFDGLAVTNGFSIAGRGQLNGGLVHLAAGARLSLPPLRTGLAIAVTAGLSPDSGRSAVLLLQWEGSSRQAAAVPLAADNRGLAFRIAADGLSVVIPSVDGDRTVKIPGPTDSGAGLLASLESPPDAASDLIIDSVLALTARQ